MDKVEINGIEIKINKDGFIQDPDLWNEEVACEFAKLDGTGELSEKHWEIIYIIRNHWEETDLAPPVRKLCKITGLKLREIYDLFPRGPAKGACKIACLPKPDGCV